MGFFSELLGKTAAKASTQAAQIQAQAAGKARKEAIGEIRPYEETGRAGFNTLADALGINGPEAQAQYFANFQNDPGYQATLGAGLDAIGQGQTFAGNYRSGSTLRSLLEHGQRMQFEQFQNRLNKLTGVGDVGLNAANRIADIQYGSRLSQGNALASGVIGAANARTAGAQNLFNAGVGLLGSAIGAGGGSGRGPYNPNASGMPWGPNYRNAWGLLA